MRISVLQPKIIRGNIEHNVGTINRLLKECEGDFAVLCEYALTGPLFHNKNTDPQKWAPRSEAALKSLIIPKGKVLLLNHLVNDGGKLYNQCTLLPDGDIQRKCFLDPAELSVGITPGKDFPLFTFNGKKYKVIICTDLRNIDNLSTQGADFVFFIYHFGNKNIGVIDMLQDLSLTRKVPIIVASLCSDKNCGHSMYGTEQLPYHLAIRSLYLKYIYKF